MALLCRFRDLTPEPLRISGRKRSHMKDIALLQVLLIFWAKKRFWFACQALQKMFWFKALRRAQKFPLLVFTPNGTQLKQKLAKKS